MKYFIKGNNDVLAHNPFWLAIVLPFSISDTFTKSDQEKDNPVSINTPIILDTQIQNWVASNSKESFTGVAQFTLMADAPVDDFNSEDWLVFWSFDNWADYEYTKVNLQKLIDNQNYDILNSFTKAPKFVGQIQTINRSESVLPNGAINLNFVVSAHSFTPFAANQWFDPVLEQYTKNASTWWSNFSSFKYKTDEVQAGIIAAQKALISLLNITLATGPDKLIFQTAGQRPVSPNTKFLIPELLVKIFRSEAPLSGIFSNFGNPFENKKSQYTYLDLLDTWVGIQKYNSGGDENNTDIRGVFIPNNLNEAPLENTETIYETINELEGQMPLGPLNFNNQQTWSILDTYLNRPINEMYTAMKPNRDGRIIPTFIARQNPLPLRSGFEEKVEKEESVNNVFDFSFKDFYKDRVVTYFDELPNWEIDSQYVIGMNIGKTGSARTNFVSLTPFNGLKGESERNAVNANLSLPVMDNIDIQRNGLRPIIGSIPSAWLNDLDTTISQRNGFANQLMSSITFNGHLKLSGTIQLLGIQHPIQHGDNVTIDGITFHIEKVVHQGSIQPTGIKIFFTELSVSHGVVLDSSGKHTFAKLGIPRHTVSKE